MRRFVLGLFAAIGILTVLAVLGAGLAAWRLVATRPALPDRIVIKADLSRGLRDGASPTALRSIVFGNNTPTLRDFLDALDRAAGDPRVKGIYVRTGGDSLGLAKVQQVRDAVHAFRAKGKFAIVFADSFGDFGPGTRPYYLATAFDRVWLQPLGTVGLVGLRTEMTFFRGALDKLGITASFSHREQFKTAANALTETSMTAPQREEVADLLNSNSAQIVAGIAADRGLTKETVAALIDRGPFSAEEAKAAHLVDSIGYRDEAEAAARQRAGAGAKLVSIRRYLRGAGHPHNKGPEIALIYGTGVITSGDAPANPLFGGEGMSARQLSRAFRQAAADKKVRAILFRIDSPGGSATASETIWREVAQARKHGKPVIVSMGDVAASGGYYIAAPADKIVAEPATLTGSIGVLTGKLVIGQLLQNLGITAQSVERGANASMDSPFENFSPAERARIESFLDVTYEGFKARVASGRHLSAKQVEAAAKGRVWTGEEAKAKGLVDALGGYETALRLARVAAHVPNGERVKLVTFPKEKGTVERIYDRLTGRGEGGEGAMQTATAGIASRLAGVLAAVDGLVADRGVLRMPALGEIR